MILEVFWDGMWTLSFGLSRFHGHGSWLVCEVALSFHVGCSPTRFYIIMGWKCLHVDKHNTPIQPHYGGMFECGQPWTRAARLP